MFKYITLALMLSACGQTNETCKHISPGTKQLTYTPVGKTNCSEPIFKVFEVTQTGLVVPNSGCSVEASTIPGVCETGFDIHCSVSGTTYELYGEFDDTGSKVVQYTTCHGQDCCVDEYVFTWETK
jgi:hypothetical protein